jgi:tRNA uridine 5-carbamoylmethylation protein Kti12
MIVRIAKMYNISTDRILTGEQTRNASKRLSLSANTSEYNKDIYGDEYLSELTSSEKLFIMKFRQLTSKDKQKVADLLNDILPEL